MIVLSKLDSNNISTKIIFYSSVNTPILLTLCLDILIPGAAHMILPGAAPVKIEAGA